jgi:hypothetical protein
MKSLSASMFLFATILLVGCDNKSSKWVEQVKLEDGEVVLVRRSEIAELRFEIGGPSSAFPLGETLEIFVDGKALPVWKDEREPLLLMRHPFTKDFVLVTSTGDSRVWARHDRPMNQYWMFRLYSGRWIEEPIADFVFGRPTNITAYIGQASQIKGTVTLEQKAKWLEHENLAPSYRRVEKHYQFGND